MMDTRISWKTEFQFGDVFAQPTPTGDVLISGGAYPSTFSLCLPVGVAEQFAAQVAFAANAVRHGRHIEITESEGGEL
jgi:hypothetical protein